MAGQSGGSRASRRAFAGLDRFEIYQKLGAGGMGAVYRAYDRDRKIEVALKSLLGADPRALYRFKREFRTLADVIHPNLVSLYELHTSGDEWFFTMELVDGVPFVAWVRPFAASVPQPDPASIPAEATITNTEETRVTGVWRSTAQGRDRVRLGTPDHTRLHNALFQLSDGVVALHRAGKLHRDIKPSNVLVEGNGRVVLLDFGLTSDKEGMAEDRTHDTVAVGTPMYMSPEQAADVPLDEASDWYSVGVMLYESLTGERPFEGSRNDVVLRKQTEDPPPPSALAEGVPPGLDALCVRLLARDPRARPRGDELLGLLDRAPSEATLQLGRAAPRQPFVGRQREMAALRTALEDSRLGNSVATFVRGASGIGKSALVRRFLAEVSASTDAVILEGRCYERESVPFKALDAVVDALSRHLLALPADEVMSLVPRDVMALSRLFPVLRRVPSIAEPLQRGFAPPDPIELRRRAFGALRFLLKRIGRRRPVVVYIDDLQWGDVDSLSFLGDLIYHPAPPSILILLTYRLDDEERSPLISQLRTQAFASPDSDVRDLTLETLPHDEATALLRELGLSPRTERLDQMLKEAAGHPFFLAELARHGAETDPAWGSEPITLDALLRRRIDALDPSARALLVTSSVAASPMRPDVLVRAAGVPGQGPDLNQLRKERLVRSRLGADGGYMVEPYHDRVRAVAVASLDVDGRRACHRAIAAVLEGDATLGEVEPEVLVEHWLGANEAARAGRYALEAATRAEETCAFNTAARYYELAIEHGAEPARRHEFEVLRGHALKNAGRLEDAAAAFAAAALEVEGEEHLELRRLEMEQLLRHGDVDSGLERARAVLGAVGLKPPATDRAAMTSLVWQRVLLRVRGMSFTETAESAISRSDLQRLDVCWSVASAFSFVNPFVARALQMRFMRLALQAGEPSRMVRAFTLELGYRAMAGSKSYDDVRAVYERAKTLTSRLGDPKLSATLEGGAGIAAFLVGRFRDAEAYLADADDRLREHSTDARWELDISQLVRTSALVCMGRIGTLIKLIPALLREAEERGDVYAARGLRTWRGNFVWLALDRPADARRFLDDGEATGTFHLHHYYELVSLLQIDMYEGRFHEVWTQLRRRWRQIDRAMLLRIQSLRIELRFMLARAALGSLAQGSRTDKLRVAAAAAKALDKEGADWATALAHLVRAGLARAVGEQHDAIDALRLSIPALDGCDMALHAAVARRRLGEHIAGTEGASLIAECDEFLANEGVVAPDKIIALTLPHV
jgi:serine/threonine protein kinase/tetratricopeptide (TPR) repeat protein